MTPSVLIRFIPKLILIFAFIPPMRVPISAGLEHTYASYSNSCKVCEMMKKNMKNSLMKLYIQNSLRDLECGLPYMEANSIVNLVLFG